MDTPQVTPGQIGAGLATLALFEAVFAPAADGGYAPCRRLVHRRQRSWAAGLAPASVSASASGSPASSVSILDRPTIELDRRRSGRR
jgi:hypothetical protein